MDLDIISNNFKNSNKEGFELLDMFKKLEVDLLGIRKRITAIERKTSFLKAAHITLRYGVLEKSYFTNRKQVSLTRESRIARDRNMIAHGGDVIGDLEAIQNPVC